MDRKLRAGVFLRDTTQKQHREITEKELMNGKMLLVRYNRYLNQYIMFPFPLIKNVYTFLFLFIYFLNNQDHNQVYSPGLQK